MGTRPDSHHLPAASHCPARGNSEDRLADLGYLIFSGFAGSAVGTIFFTLALKNGNPTVVNVVLNIQPVLSTTAACLLFGDRLARQFVLYASIAVVAGVFVSVEHPTLIVCHSRRPG